MSVKSAKASARSGGKAAEKSPADSRGRIERTRAYIEELKHEMRLVTWPNREQVRSTTVVVIITVFFFGVYFGVVDYILAIGQTALYGAFTN